MPLPCKRETVRRDARPHSCFNAMAWRCGERLIGRHRRKLEASAAQPTRWHAGEVKGGRAPTLAGVTKKVNGWLRARHLGDLLRVTIGEREGLPTLEHTFDAEAWERLQSTLLGKTLLFTDNDDASDAKILRGYRA